MSDLSKYIHKFQTYSIIKRLVEYLETVDIPGPQKKALVILITKAIVKATGGKWEKSIETAVAGAIEWVLREIREDAGEFYEDDPVLVLPTPDEKYYIEIPAPVDWSLYKDEDRVFRNDAEVVKYWVVPAGDRPFKPTGFYHAGYVQDGKLDW